MTNEQIVREVVGRMADEAPRPLDFDELGDPLVGVPDSVGSRSRTRRIVVLAAVLAVSAVFAVSALMTTRTSPEGATPVGTPTEATAGEFNEALTAALAVLDGAPGIEGFQESYIQTHLAGKVWFSTRHDGDAIVVEQTDVDVHDSAWWLTSASPPAVGENITTTARVIVDGAYYQASMSERDSQRWRQLDSGPPAILAFGLALFDDEFGPQLRNQITPPGAEVARQFTANGGQIWTLTSTYDGATGEQRFYIHPDGYLASWSWQALGIDPEPTDQTVPSDAGNISYQPLENPDELTAPEVGTPLDLPTFDLPEGFRIGE